MTKYNKLMAYALTLCPAWSFANPTGGQVVSGSATIQNVNPAHTVINQSSPTALINWQTFNIGQGQHTQFIQPSSSSIAVNRVIGGNPSQIFGMLTANGRIVLINPRGIWFGPSAVVDVASLVATTNNISNQNFKEGKYQFDPIAPGDYHGSVVNEGRITVADQGLVALMAPGVANKGVIQANVGQVILASGSAFTLDFYGDKLINFAVTQETTKAGKDQNGQAMTSGVSNSGKIMADGGQVTLTARTASKVVENSINVSGIVQANSVMQKDGKIYLTGGDNGTVKVSGTLTARGNAPGTKGGNIQVAGKKVQLVGKAKLDASGQAGGGKILVGSKNQTVNTAVGKDVQIHADALTLGDGGTIIVWSDDHTDMFGTATARGGPFGGNGGFIETSGLNTIDFSGAIIDAYAPLGTSGLWLVDPHDITINNALANTIENALAAGTSFTLDSTTGTGGTGIINVNADIIENTTVGTPTLTFISADTINFNDSVSGDFHFVINNGGDINFETGAGISVNDLTITPTGAFKINVNVATTVTADNHTYNLPINLLADLTLAGTGTKEINNGVIGNNSSTLTITGPVAFNSTVTGVDALSVSGATTINTTAITTATTQTYNNPVTLDENTNLTGSTIIFNSNVIGAGNDLTITGNATLGNASTDTFSGVDVFNVTGNTSVFDATISTTGNQTYQGNVTLNNNINFSTPGVVSFNGNIIGGANNLTATSGSVVLGNAVTDTITNVDNLTLDDATINVASITTNAAQDYSGVTTLALGNKTLTGTTIAIDNIVGNNFNLDLHGTTTLGNGALSTITGLNNLTLHNAAILNLPSLSTTGIQDYLGNLTLQRDLTLTASQINVDGNIIGNTHALTLQSPTTLGDSATDTVSGVTTLTTNGPLTINAGSISTTANHVYNGIVDILNNITLNSTTGVVNFNNNVDAHGKNVTITGDALLSNSTYSNFNRLIVNGDTQLNAATLGTTTDMQFNGLLTLGTTSVLTSPILSFESINGGGFGLSMTGNATVGASVGDSISNLTSLAITGNGVFNAGSYDLPTMSTTGTMTFNNNVSLLQDLALTGTPIQFNSNITGLTRTLTLNSNATLGNAGNETVSLGTLTANNPLSLNLASITTTNDQVYGVPVTLLANATLVAPNITLNNVIGNNHNLTLNPTTNANLGTTGAETFTGLNTFTVNGIANLNLASITSTGNQNYNNTVNLLANADLTGSPRFNGSVVGNGFDLTTHGATFFGSTGAETLTGVDALTVNGNTTMNIANVTTTGAQLFDGNLTLQNSPVLASGVSTTVTGNLVGNNNNLTVNNDLAIGDSASDSISTMNTLAVTGNADFNIGSLGASVINATGTQTHHLNFQLTKNIAFGGGQIDILGNIAGGNRTITLNGPSTLGSTGAQTWTNVSNLTTNAPTSLNLASIQTNGFQTYQQPITLLADATLVGAPININTDIIGNGNDLTLTAGNVNLGSAGTETISGVDHLIVNGATNYNLASLSTTGAQDYFGAMNLLAHSNFTGTNIYLQQGVTGNNFDMTATGNVNFDGPVNLVHDLKVIGNTDLHTGSVKTSGSESYLGSLTIREPTTFDSGGSIVVGGQMIMQNVAKFLTADKDVAFNDVITGSKNLNFDLGLGNLAFNSPAASSLGEVVVNDVGNITNNGHLYVTKFTQLAGTGFSNFGMGTLDAGLNDVFVTTNGDILGQIIAGNIDLATLAGLINVDVTAYYTMSTYSLNGVTITGSIAGVSILTGNPYLIPGFKVQPGSIGLIYFNGQAVANRADDSTDEYDEARSKSKSAQDDEYQHNHENIFGEEDHSCS